MADATKLVNLGDAEPFDSLVQSFIALLGRDWLDEVLRIGTLGELKVRVSASQDGENFLRALRAHASTLKDDQTVRDRGDRQLRLRLGSIALVVDQIQQLARSDRVRSELRSLARAWQFERFFDKLFEAEAALHWSHAGGVATVEFPEQPHPDFWADVALERVAVRFPHECKRIEPVDLHSRALESFADKLEKWARETWASIGALKLTVWLHARPEQVGIDALLATLGELAGLARASGSIQWQTRSDSAGSYQLCLSLAPEWNDLVPGPIKLPDIPVQPILRLCAESVYRGTPNDPVRLKYAVSLRTDVLPRRIGAFERNLSKALEQLALSHAGIPGIVNIRLRPPRDLGDLFEADAIARRVLASPEAGGLALVCLFWNESEREEGQWLGDPGQSAREVREMYHLRVHYVAGTRTPVDFSRLDSAASRFPKVDGELMRDSGSGTLAPIAPNVLALLDDPMTVEELSGAPAGESKDAATLYFKLQEPYREDVKEVLRVFRIGSRVFMAAFVGDWTFRIIEFEKREPVRVATIDLRPWLGQSEFLFHIRDASGEWLLSAGHVDEITEARAKSVPMPKAFIREVTGDSLRAS